MIGEHIINNILQTRHWKTPINDYLKSGFKDRKLSSLCGRQQEYVLPNPPFKDIYQIPLQDSALEGLVENVFPVPALQEVYFALPPVAANQKEHLFAACLE